MRSLGKKPHFWHSQRLKKVLLTAQGCALAHNNANPSGLSEKKVYCVEKRDMCDPWGKNPIFGLPRGYKSYLALSAACTKVPNAFNPSGTIRKKFLLCKSTKKARYVRSLGKKPHFWHSQRLKKVLLTAQGCARLRTGPIITQIPRGYQKKKFIV